MILVQAPVQVLNRIIVDARIVQKDQMMKLSELNVMIAMTHAILIHATVTVVLFILVKYHTAQLQQSVQLQPNAIDRKSVMIHV
jgi:adenylate kinase